MKFIYAAITCIIIQISRILLISLWNVYLQCSKMPCNPLVVKSWRQLEWVSPQEKVEVSEEQPATSTATEAESTAAAPVVDEATRFKYPHIASEILTCEVQQGRYLMLLWDSQLCRMVVNFCTKPSRKYMYVLNTVGVCFNNQPSCIQYVHIFSSLFCAKFHYHST